MVVRRRRRRRIGRARGRRGGQFGLVASLLGPPIIKGVVNLIKRATRKKKRRRRR